MTTTRKEYFTVFESVGEGGRAKALELALDMRKFEITLYWQRTAYFWALIAAAFAGYFVVLGAEHLADRTFNAFCLACIGFIFSFAWFRVNRGSKFWQENWEHHVDLLEDTVCGPLYKTVLQGERPATLSFAWFDGAAPVSVSRVNQWVSLFTLVVWAILAVVQVLPLNASAPVGWRYVAIVAATVVFSLLIGTRTKSKLGEDMDALVIMRKSFLCKPGCL